MKFILDSYIREVKLFALHKEEFPLARQYITQKTP